MTLSEIKQFDWSVKCEPASYKNYKFYEQLETVSGTTLPPQTFNISLFSIQK